MNTIELPDDHEFEDIEALQAFLKQQQQQINHAPQPDFDMLNPLQFGAILYGQSPEHLPFRLREDIPAEVWKKLPFYQLAKHLMGQIKRAGGTLKLTPKGRLNKKTTDELYATGWIKDFFLETGKWTSTREDRVEHLWTLRVVCELSPLFRKSRGLKLTKLGQKLYDDDDDRALFEQLFTAHYRKYNLGMIDGYEDELPHNTALPFTLYLLLRHGREERPDRFYQKLSIRALERVLLHLNLPDPVGRFASAYRIRLFERMLEWYGLVEFGDDKRSLGSTPRDVRATDALYQIFELAPGLSTEELPPEVPLDETQPPRMTMQSSPAEQALFMRFVQRNEATLSAVEQIQFLLDHADAEYLAHAHGIYPESDSIAEAHLMDEMMLRVGHGNENVSLEWASTQLQELADRYPRFAKPLEMLAGYQKDPKDALPYLDEAVRRGKARLIPARLREFRHRIRDLSLANDYYNNLHTRALVHLTLGNTAEAVRDLGDLLDLDHRDPHGLRHFYGSMLFVESDRSEFEEFYDRYADDPHPAWEMLRAAYLFRYDSDEAATTALRRVWEVNPEVFRRILSGKQPTGSLRFVPFPAPGSAEAAERIHMATYPLLATYPLFYQMVVDLGKKWVAAN